MIWACLFSLAILIFPLVSHALTIQEVPNPRQATGGWVTDMANLLSPQTEAQINGLISQLEAQNGTELAVVTVPTTAPAASPKAFTTALFNEWRIGKQGQDNGILFLVSLGDRRVEIETGYGVEGVLPDGRVGRILNNHILPRFRENDYEGGILAGTQALVLALEEEAYNPILSPVVDQPDPVKQSGFAGIVAAIAATIGSYFSLKHPLYLDPQGRSRVSSEGGGVSRFIYIAFVGIVFTLSLLGCIILLGSVNIISFLIVVVIALIAAFPLKNLLVRLLRGKNAELQPVRCQQCHSPMVEVVPDPQIDYLSSGDRVAQQLGSEKFTVWRCPQCSPQLTPDKVHIRSRRLFSKYELCPQCNALTLEKKTQTTRQPTQWNSGTRLITINCHHCSYHRVDQETIPPLPPPSSSSGGGGFSGGSSGSSGGGSFGGGSSGGGGAGGSW